MKIKCFVTKKLFTSKYYVKSLMPENVSQFKRSNMDNHQHYHVSCSIVHGVMQWGIHGKCPNDDNCRNVRGNSSDQRWKNSSRIAICIKYGNFTQIFLVYLKWDSKHKIKINHFQYPFFSFYVPKLYSWPKCLKRFFNRRLEEGTWLSDKESLIKSLCMYISM